jgi:hypothetical protein
MPAAAFIAAIVLVIIPVSGLAATLLALLLAIAAHARRTADAIMLFILPASAGTAVTFVLLGPHLLAAPALRAHAAILMTFDVAVFAAITAPTFDAVIMAVSALA